jgi:hypothetical protein
MTDTRIFRVRQHVDERLVTAQGASRITIMFMP